MHQNILNKSTNLDLLRAIAVTYVVLDHSFKFLGHTFVFGRDVNWLGRLGVMFFFVHTCTVLMLSLERLNTQTTLLRAATAFYIRRVFRIYPLSIFAIAMVVIASIPSEAIIGYHTILGFRPTRNELLGNVLLISNHWPDGGRNILGVLWSLPYEVQMYFFLPWLFVLQARFTTLWPLIALWFTSWIPAHMNSLFSFAPHFSAGVLAYSAARQRQTFLLSAWLLPVIIVALTIVFFLLGPSIILGAYVCLILGLMLPRFSLIKAKALNSVTYNVAKYSYGIYLAHTFCLWFAFIKIPHFHFVAFLSLLIGIPILLFYLIESPLIKIGIKLGGWTMHSSSVSIT